MAGTGYLLLRRGGGLWGLPHGAVAALARRAHGGFAITLTGRHIAAPGPCVEVGGEEPNGRHDRRVGGVANGVAGDGAPRVLAADEVLGVTGGLTVRTAAAALRRFWPERAAGLAVHAGVPLVVVDPEAPPRALLDDG